MVPGSSGCGVSVGGVLLTGGASRRMGRDKATLDVGGVSLARRVGSALSEVAAPCLEIGSGVAGLGSLLIDTERRGPLVALAKAAAWFSDHRSDRTSHVVTLACDLPLITPTLLRWLVEHPSERSVIPVVGGYPQPLCARWTRADLDLASRAVAAGATAVHELVRLAHPDLVQPAEWAHVAPPDVFDDVDTPEDWHRLVTVAANGTHAVEVA